MGRGGVLWLVLSKGMTNKLGWAVGMGGKFTRLDDIVHRHFENRLLYRIVSILILSRRRSACMPRH